MHGVVVTELQSNYVAEVHVDSRSGRIAEIPRAGGLTLQRKEGEYLFKAVQFKSESC